MFKSGTKRPASSEFTFSSNDPSSKRVMEGSTSDVHGSEISNQSNHHVTTRTNFNIQRAELARQHVRALNSQFGSWVHQQLENHQDELWEDGVRDYLSHASQLMEKFKDVVDWLRANSMTSQLASTSSNFGSQIPENSNANILHDDSKVVNPLLPANSNSQTGKTQHVALFSSAQTPLFSGSFNDQKLVDNSTSDVHMGVYNGFSKPMTPNHVSFSNVQSHGSQSSTLFSLGQSFGNPAAKQSTEESADDADEETEQRPGSPSLEKTEEKGIVIAYEAKCKVYVKPDDPMEKGWKDRGLGHLSIKYKEGASKGSKESKPVIIIRNDVGKILLNASIYTGIKTSTQKNTVASIFHTSEGSSKDGSSNVIARTYLLKVKDEVEATKLAAAIKEHAPQD